MYDVLLIFQLKIYTNDEYFNGETINTTYVKKKKENQNYVIGNKKVIPCTINWKII